MGSPKSINLERFYCIWLTHIAAISINMQNIQILPLSCDSSTVDRKADLATLHSFKSLRFLEACECYNINQGYTLQVEASATVTVNSRFFCDY
jgi:hypothetical protein